MKNKRQQVLEAIRAAGPNGLTDEEIQNVCKHSRHAAPRRHELMVDGLIESLPEKRDSSLGIPSYVWVAK